MFLDRVKTQLQLFKLIRNTIRHKPGDEDTFADLLEMRAKENPKDVFLLFEDRRITFSDFNARANQVANWGAREGLLCGQRVALLMENRPEFILTWAGLAKIGVVTALINTNLRGDALAQALEACEAEHWIVGNECLEQLGTLEEIPEDVGRWIVPDGDSLGELPRRARNLNDCLDEMPSTNVHPHLRKGLHKGDDLFYIYTSGTTGLPKPAHFSHMRFISQGDAMIAITDYKVGDVIYCALPLYHGAGGALVPSMALNSGCAMALRRKFSAREFWDDCRRYNVTGFQYVGEFCRYLLNQTTQIDDRHHKVRIMLGAGLGPDIWEKFQKRFGIERVIESFGSTEANTSVINLDNKPGSIGRIPFKALHNGRLIRYDFDGGSNPRDNKGLCIECAPDEPGEFIGRLPKDDSVGAGRFEGYTSEGETEKKILRDVFKKGDAWFRSGDILRCDKDGFFFFVDRVGDTFRWKSENVSTQAVAEALASFPGVNIVNVYGVDIPGHDGRAGMAALVLEPHREFHGESFFEHCTRELPGYAAPVFVRIQKAASLTGTFKLRKVDLQREGFDLENVSDPLYVRDDKEACYVPFTQEWIARLPSERF